jgi:hypothetical protein
MSGDAETPEATQDESHRAPEPANRADMSRRRKALVSVITLAFVIAAGVQIVENRDDWPFSNFHMYSRIQSNRHATTVALGVGPDGEFFLETTMTAPITGSRLQAALSALARRSKKGSRALEVIHSIYERGRALGRHTGPRLIALRLVTRSWSKLQANLSNLTSPREQEKAYVAFLDDSTRATLARRAKGDAPPAELQRMTGPGTVIAASSMTLSGQAELLDDRYAGTGKALVIRGKASRKQPQAQPEGFAEAHFTVPSGTYQIWLRGTVARGKRQGSVWLQFDNQIRSRSSPSKGRGFGHWARLYPAGAYGWSSAVPGSRPASIKLAAGKHRLRISARHGNCVVDQIWLSRDQREAPTWTGPVTLEAGNPQ